MKRPIGRRSFLRSTAAGLPLLAHAAAARAGSPDARLLPDPKGLLDLPEGFSYRVLTRRGDVMSDGYRTPGNPDAMGVFAGEAGKLVLMRNHELAVGDDVNGPYASGQAVPPESYDARGYGGVTRLVLDEETLEVEHSNLVLTGTHWNCAGGHSPWGWLSCEEVFVPDHGYVFLCDPTAKRVAQPRPIKAYGRFRHEAATVDPQSHIAFLTEDMEDAAFYRFVPRDPERPFEGQLQALAIAGQPGFDTNSMAARDRLPVTWVNIDEPDPRDDDVRHQAHARGAARFHRTEGMWLAGDDLYMTATTGGPIGRGQIFRLHHRPRDGGELELLAHTVDPAILDMPDNLTVSPLGQIYVAEDGLDGNFLRHVTLDGRITTFARNAGSSSELAGLCFAPDGDTMFVNLQRDGLTLAIRGPFDSMTSAARVAAHADAEDSRGKGLAGLGGGLAVLALAAWARRRRSTSKQP